MLIDTLDRETFGSVSGNPDQELPARQKPLPGFGHHSRSKVALNHDDPGVRNVVGTEIEYFSQLLVDNVAAVVPEPGTWAMLLMEFGVMASVLRGRRRAGRSGSLAA